MTVPDSTPNELAPAWGEDVIYSEAVCHVDDVYYEGSEDEKYPDSATRKLRIEAVGRRYLEGHVPFLLSASLRGPFDKESGWVNPWRSKQRAATFKPPSPILDLKEASRLRNEPITRAQRGLISDSLECHLPSPESLKQATVTEPHPYLEEDELATVQSWRKSVHVPSLSRDSFWASTRAQITASAKKRRAKESEWLKRVANKKRKTYSSDPSFSKSPLVQRNPNPRVSPVRKLHSGGFGNSVHASPKRNPGRSLVSSQRSKSRVQWHGTKDDEGDQSEPDELVTSTPDASFGSAHGPLGSIPKRISPRRDMWKSAVLHIVGSEDELSQSEAAASTLSSPVSQRREGLPTCALNPNAVKQDPTASVGTQTSPPGGKQLNMRSEALHVIDLTDTDEKHDSARQNRDRPTATDDLANDFETQQDQSFCFRMRHNPEADAEDEIAGEMLLEESNQPEESASLKVAGLPNPPSHSPHVVDSTTMQHARGDNVGALSIEEAEQTETTDKPDVQFTMQHSADNHEIQALLSCDHNAGSLDSTSSNVSKNGDQQANTPLPPVQLVRGDFLATAGSQTGMDTSPPSPMDVSREQDHGCLDSALENEFQCGVDHAAAQEDGVLAPEAGHTVPAGSETELQQGHHASCSPSPVVSGNGSITARMVETAEPVATPGILDECLRPVDNDDAPMEEATACPADKDPNEFSFKNILHRLVPSSPWTRLSQLTSRSTSSLAPTAKVEGAGDKDLAETCCDFEARDDANELDFASSCSQHSFVNEQNDSTTAGALESVVPRQPSLEADLAAAATEPRRDDTLDEMVSEEDMETNETAHLPKASDNIRITESQQSPWTKTQLSQQAVLPSSHAPVATIQVSSSNDAQAGESQRAIPLEAQSPWSGGAHIAVDARPESAMTPHEAGCNAEEEGHAQDSQVSQSEPRPSTPEPQFAFKSFASFMSPSPERSRRQTGRTRLQGSGGSLPSAIKNPWSDSRANRRVSWALKPQDREDDTRQDLEGWESATSTSRRLSRQVSPPPSTPIGELPTSEDARFNKHFSAVASRTDGFLQKLIPTASQQVAQSPGLHGMAETFLAADVAGNDTEAADAGEQVEEPEADHDTAEPESQEPVDVVEDMFREMGDFLQVWDVDAELNHARKATNHEVQQVHITSQSPW
ncbi:Uncharacterized protein TPAR_07319 [Tolypocladium paradoxum]|uniref:Protamine P1 n=1 Tax=Tolypocladium paradoxum TaxID=94208 RepID=A0A2S4KQN2_9HYPO|nr:Uncharacterized protein TPAR_07319 [Tolypocladium paradoxum]